jgi:hypothetical protein
MARTMDILSADEKAEIVKAADGVRRAAILHLQADRSRTAVVAFVANLQRGVDKVVQSANHQGSGFDCRAGCSHCCHVRVEAFEAEIFRIAAELLKWPAGERAALLQRLHAHVEVTADAAREHPRTPCPFLADNRCAVYDVRPSVCRKTHSLDVEKCRQPPADIPESLEVVMKAEALMRGTRAAYREAGLPASGHELGQAVLRALRDETLEARWHAGEAVFDAPGSSPEAASR